ncbi:hypothetical protein GCM10027615_55760 [Plantactinospora veratri]
MAGTLAGNLQVTAVQPNAGPRRCKVARWGASGVDIIAYVACFDQGGAPVNSEFTLSYHRERAVYGSFGPPKYTGYFFSAGAGQTNWNYPAGGFGFNSSAPRRGRHALFRQHGQPGAARLPRHLHLPGVVPAVRRPDHRRGRNCARIDESVIRASSASRNALLRIRPRRSSSKGR